MTPMDLLPLVGATALLGLSPGPVVAAVVATAAVHGVRACSGLVLGVVIGDIILVGAVLAGLAAVAEALGPWFWAVKLAAGGYLVWLGLQAWRRAAEPVDGHAQARRLGRSVAAGTLINLSNPKAIGFYAAFLPTFVNIEALRLGEGLAVIAICAIVPVLTNAGYALAAARAGRLFYAGRAARRLNQASGTVLIVAGVTVAAR